MQTVTEHLITPSFSELVRVFARIGMISFGGPAGQIALMHRELVDERRWISEAQYLNALNFCHLLPGPEAQQLATWIGWKLHGPRGGIAAGTLFIVPGASVIMLLAILYGYAAHLDWFQALFLGVKAAVLAIVVQALLRIAGRALGTPFKQGVALAAFVGLFLFALPFPIIVFGAAMAGAIVSLSHPEWLALKENGASASASDRPWQQSLASLAIGGTTWAAPMLLLIATLGQDHVLWKIGSFFSQLAVVTFGGAYAVLAYMGQEAVQSYGWLTAGEMADGLGLAETTPGPLILVTQFVGYLAAFRTPAPFSPLVAGLLGAGLTLWVTFVPCFVWIFTFAPWIERLQQARRLSASLATLTAAIVGVIANLSLWFMIHLLFKRVSNVTTGPLTIQIPEWASFDWRAGIIAAIAALLLFRFRWSVIQVLGLSALLGLCWGH